MGCMKLSEQKRAVLRGGLCDHFCAQGLPVRLVNLNVTEVRGNLLSGSKWHRMILSEIEQVWVGLRISPIETERV